MKTLIFTLGALLVGLSLGLNAVPTRIQSAFSTEGVYSCPSWITATYSAIPKWKMVGCVYQDETQSGGDTNIYVTVKDADGSNLSGVQVHQAWPDGDVSQSTIGGTTSFAMGGSNCDPNAGRPGALTIYIENKTSSDAVTGMCLPLNRHVRFFLTFQKTGATPITPTLVAPTPITPVPGIYVTKSQLIEIFQHAIDVLK